MQCTGSHGLFQVRQALSSKEKHELTYPKQCSLETNVIFSTNHQTPPQSCGLDTSEKLLDNAWSRKFNLLSLSIFCSVFLPLASSLRSCRTAPRSQSTEAYAWGMVVFDWVSLCAITFLTLEAGTSVKVPCEFKDYSQYNPLKAYSVLTKPLYIDIQWITMLLTSA